MKDANISVKHNGLIAKDSSQFISLNLGINQIGSKGCQFLSQAHWQNLQIL